MKLYTIKPIDWSTNFFSNDLGYMSISQSYSNELVWILEWKFLFERTKRKTFPSEKHAQKYGEKVYTEILEKFLIHSFNISIDMAEGDGITDS